MLEEQAKDSSDNRVKVSNIYLHLYYVMLGTWESVKWCSPHTITMADRVKSRWQAGEYAATLVKGFGAYSQLI